MRTFLSWIVVCLLLLGIYFLYACSESVEIPRLDETLNISSLQVRPVNLGTLKPGETRPFKVSLRNTSRLPIALSSPQADCGCIFLGENKPLTLTAEKLTELEFSFRAPTWPCDVRKKITFAAQDSPGFTWEAGVTAHVVAKAWAVPSALELSWDRDSDLEPSIVLYHDEQTEIGPVVSNSPGISVNKETQDSGKVRLNLTIHPPPLNSGDTWKAILQVFDSNCQSELLQIPVHITRSPELRCIPSEIRLKGSSELGEKTVFVAADAEVGPQVEAKPLFPWIHIKNLERKSRGFRVHLSFDPKAVPADFHENIVQFSVPNKRGLAYLHGASDH